MKLRLIIITAALMLLPALPLQAVKGSERLRAGLEWGYHQSLWRHYHLNYLTDANARVDSKGAQWKAIANGHAGLYAGLMLSDRWEADLTASYAGVWGDRRVFPITTRVVHYFSDFDAEGTFKAFAEGGPLVSNNYTLLPSWLLRAGAGRRHKLSRRMSLDFSLDIQCCFDHPEHVYDPRNDIYVREEKALRNNSTCLSCGVSLSLNF